jgi:hypothetical protein
MKTNSVFFSFCIFILCGVWSACVKSFVPDIEKYEEALVVDGSITNAPGPYTIRLSKSARIQERSQFIPYTNCVVLITDDVGNKATLTERTSGLYQTDSSAMQGIPGRKYKLSITTPEGDEYESTQELLVKGLGIQAVYGELEHKTDPSLFHGRDGYQFYVDVEKPATTNNYLFWRMQSTYKFRADFSILSYIDGNGLHPVFSDSLKTCYRTVDVLDLYLLDNNELKQQEIKRIPINYEDNYTKALSIRYSLNVSQFTINKATYDYWSSVKKIIGASADLYTQQPYQVKNNLVNLTHPEKPVFGYFMVAGLSEKRIFVDPPPIVFRYDVCIVGSEPQPHILDLFKDKPNVWPVFFASTPRGLYYIDQECVDCRKKGTLLKPAFWVE